MDTPQISPSTQYKLPQPNLNPPFNITRASHMVFTARDLAASRDFYTEVVGLVVSDETPDTIWLRGLEERCHHSLTLKRTTARPECEHIGMRVFTEDDLDKAKTWLDGRGLDARWVEVPYQGRTLQFNDPIGTPIELCATMHGKPRLHTKIQLHRGAAAMRMDHYQVLVPDVMAASKFYMDLGFRISDYIGVESTDIVVGAFLHRKNNPWDIVFLTRSGPRYHHAGYVVESTNAIIRACDVAGNLGFADLIEHGPGRHGHTHSYYCYMRDPDGHRIELLLPGIQVIDIDDEPDLFLASPESTTNLWGLPPPKSWVEEATSFAGVTLRRLAVEGGPKTAEEYLASRLPARVVAALDTVGF